MQSLYKAKSDMKNIPNDDYGRTEQEQIRASLQQALLQTNSREIT
jgi:hypothetical protein